MKPIRIFYLAAATLFGSLAPSVWAQELLVRGLSYSPFRDGQSPATGVYPTRGQIMEDLRILRRFTPAIRFYGLSGTQSLIPTLARANGLQCYAGAWISSDRVANTNEIAKLKRIARNGQATAVVVGNEVLQRRDLSADELVQLIAEVKRVSKVPVGYADSPTEWLHYPQVAAAVDFLLVHIHPFWDGIPSTAAANYVRQRYHDVVSAYPGKPVIVGETGWPTAGAAKEAAIPGLERQEAFIEDFTPLALAEGMRYFLFEAFDEAWKTNEGLEAEGHWGLFESNRQVKPGLWPTFLRPTPLVEITKPARSGAGPSSWGTIAGRVYGIPPAHRQNFAVVIYAGTDRWYVQPRIDQPLTVIRPNLKWGTSTHLGYEYLALLVRLPYQPPATMNAVPTPGGNILAVCRSVPQGE